MSWTVEHSDNRVALAGMDADSIDAVVTDPPYELGFMGKRWDSTGIAYDVAFWREVYRVLKPGAHLLAFGGTRTYHRMAVAIEDAGFEIRDSLHWVYTQGFPKSLDVSKAIDANDRLEPREDRARKFTAWMRSTGITSRQINEATGTQMGNHYLTHSSHPHVATAELFDKLRPLLPPVPAEIEDLVKWRTIKSENLKRREVVGRATKARSTSGASALPTVGGSTIYKDWDITTAHTPEAQRWQGWGTALKPAHEPIVLARKPLLGTVAENVLQWGTGAVNVEGCRIGDEPIMTNGQKADQPYKVFAAFNGCNPSLHLGRWPPNVILSHAPDCGTTCIPGCAVDEMERQSASSRMFPCFRYEPKPSRAEREAGCEALPSRLGAETVGRDEGSAGTQSPRAGAGRVADRVANHHPTVKPIDLMRWLCRLTTPPGGLVLDPFCGSGTTGCAAVLEGMEFLGLEREAEYVAIAEARIEYWQRQAGVVADDVGSVGGSVQLGLFGGHRER